MGKKMGINTKAVEARERKDALKKAKNEAIERKKDDEFWRDDDKHVNRKLDRQREREIKAQEERERKAANKVAYEREMELAEKSAKTKVSKQQQLAAEQPVKVTRHEIEKSLHDEQKQLNTKQVKKVNLAPIPLVPNLNHLDDGEDASNIDQALDLLKSHTINDLTAGATPSKGPTSTSKRK